MSEELEARVAALEEKCASLEMLAQIAYGEAIFAGMVAQHVIIGQAREGLLNLETIRAVIDQMTLMFEREAGSMPKMKLVFEHARSRAEASLQLLPPVPPEPR